MTKEVVLIEVDEFGDVLHHFYVNADDGGVWLGHEVAHPTLGLGKREDDIVFPPEKARALAQALLEMAKEAEKVKYKREEK